jgi:NAD(P)-dependent dehydrogenase (short-subunit alcohol dehydrogenase family)
MNRRLINKVVVITGATSGIGLATAKKLAQHGARLVLISRNSDKGEKVVHDLREVTGNNSIEFMQSDLSSQDSIRKVAKSFRKKYDRLDILINNAGAAFSEYELSDDGLEMTFALNHLGYFLLTNLLLDLLVKSAPSRIINISSGIHSRAKVDFDNLNFEQGFTTMKAYGSSKLENLYFTYELAKRLKGTGVTVNAVHPGIVNSNFGKDGRSISFAIFNHMQKYIGKTPDQGAKTAIYLALSDEVEGVSGEYFANEKLSRSSKLSHDPAIAKQLWEISERLVKLDKNPTT